MGMLQRIRSTLTTFGKKVKTAFSEDAPTPPLTIESVIHKELEQVLSEESLRKLGPDPGSIFKEIHRLDPEQCPKGLCLSGGGIRSATFSLGVLQWLAAEKKLQDFHYLSTVSGGGYIGAWLVNGLHRASAGGAGDAEAWLSKIAKDSSQEKDDPVRKLREFSNYLSPTVGISHDAFTLVAIFLRNFLINAAIWLPILAAFVAIPRAYVAFLFHEPHFDAALLAGMSAVLITVAITYIAGHLPANGEDEDKYGGEEKNRSKSEDAQGSASRRFIVYCLVPLLAAAVLLSIVGGHSAELRASKPWWFSARGFVAAGVSMHLLGAWISVAIRHHANRPQRNRSVKLMVVIIGIGALGGLLAWKVLQWLAIDETAVDADKLLYASVSSPALILVFWLMIAAQAAFMGSHATEDDREWWARASAEMLKSCLGWGLLFGTIIWLPGWLLDAADGALHPGISLSLGGGLLGIITSAIGYWSKNGSEIKRKTQTALRTLRVRTLDAAAAVVLIAILLALSLGWSAVIAKYPEWAPNVSAQNAFLRERSQTLDDHRSLHAARPQDSRIEYAIDNESSTSKIGSIETAIYQRTLLASSFSHVAIALFCLLGISLLVLVNTGINRFSLHEMYGNRLVRAYLGTGRNDRHPDPFTDIDKNDNISLEKLVRPLSTADNRSRLYPIFNMALNLSKCAPGRLDWQTRKATPFIATPLYCGAAIVNYRKTGDYAENFTLGRAMTISGAAVSPNMGYNSSRLVTLVMTLFNARLGWWQPNPTFDIGHDRLTLITRVKDWFRHHFVTVRSLLAEALGRTDASAYAINLSDGGHFDNTGIYELVRRRCHRIVAVDATWDPQYQWKDLLDVVRKIRVDFGISIGLPSVLPGQPDEDRNARLVEATIHYTDVDGKNARDGRLTILKPRLIADQDPPELLAYAKSCLRQGESLETAATFPHQKTTDMFFDEVQFESYRQLGYHTAASTLGVARDTSTHAAASKHAVASSAAAPSLASHGGTASNAPSTSAPYVVTGLGTLIERLGTSAALATALTVGGTIGIAGTMALSSTELTLSREDRELLRQGMTMQIDRPGWVDDTTMQVGRPGWTDDMKMQVERPGWIDSIKLPVGQPGQQEQLAVEMLATTKALHSAIGVLSQSGSHGVDVANQIKDLESEINRLKGQLSATKANDPELATAIREVKNSIDKLQLRPQFPVTEDVIQKMEDLLKGIQDAIKESGPRRNIRSQPSHE